MPDVATIGAFLTSLKAATDIAKALKSADISLENAETKLKMAELIESLADAKMQAADIQEVIQEKDKRIAELEAEFDSKSKLVRHYDAYYEIDDTGQPTGAPYCSHCWEVNHKRVHVHRKIGPAAHAPPVTLRTYGSEYRTSRKRGKRN